MIASVKDAPTFALIGAAGYIAPKHGAAIKAVGGRLVAACDVSDAVGWLDKDWPECKFSVFPDPWESSPPRAWFKHGADWTVICTPNHLHSQHIRDASTSGVICEKPLALNSGSLACLEKCEYVYTIMNLRHHPEILRAKRIAEDRRPNSVSVVYHAPRGPWYDTSWKGDTARSGGLIFNIGIHVIDFLLWAFGPAEIHEVQDHGPRNLSVWLYHRHPLLGGTRTKVQLSTSNEHAPQRTILYQYQDDEIGFDLAAPYSLGDDPSLHAACYRQILAGNGPGIEEARPGIELCERINEALT